MRCSQLQGGYILGSRKGVMWYGAEQIYDAVVLV